MSSYFFDNDWAVAHFFIPVPRIGDFGAVRGYDKIGVSIARIGNGLTHDDPYIVRMGHSRACAPPGMLDAARYPGIGLRPFGEQGPHDLAIIG